MLDKGYNKVESRIMSFVETVLLGETPKAFVIDPECGLMAISKEIQSEDLIQKTFGDCAKKVTSLDNRLFDIYVHKNFQVNKYKFNFNAFIITGQEMYGKVLFVGKEQNG